jgi:hypothetical protein
MSYPARDPRSGIDGQANGAWRRSDVEYRSRGATEAAA